MDVVGKWFVNIGDVPAPFVYPVELHPGGVAEWRGGERGRKPWCIAGGTLMIGDGLSELLMFDVGRAGSDWLSGVIRSFLPPSADGLEGDDDICVDDTAILMRNPADFQILEDSAARLDEIEAERQAAQNRSFAFHGEWGQLGSAIL